MSFCEPDWLALWAALVRQQRAYRSRRHPGDAWAGRTRAYQAQVRKRWSTPDSSRALVCSWLTPGTSVLDIGAGTGSWAAMFAQHGARVTALDPSEAMIAAMASTFAEEGVRGVRVIQGAWPDIAVEPHDVAFCSHGLYGAEDLRGFVEAMERAATRTCALLLRAPLLEGVMAQACRLVRGHPHDSPNFIVAYNALLQLGRLPHVVPEDGEPWGGWLHASFEEAFLELRARLGLGEGPSEQDGPLRTLLAEHLQQTPEGWRWPPSVRSALIWWEP
ncbi:MAG: class I SAM-dependent methyltransferase [Pseudomonadota bacterium]